MPLRWRYETWRKLYVREVGTFAALSLTARMLAAELLKICDDDGVIHLGGRDPVAAVCIRLAANRWERRALIPNAIKALIADGYLVLEPERLTIRNFLPAQTGIDKVPVTTPGHAPRGPTTPPGLPVNNSPVDNSGVASQRRDSGVIAAAQRRDSGGIRPSQVSQVPENTLGTDLAPFRILPSLPSLPSGKNLRVRAGRKAPATDPRVSPTVDRFVARYKAHCGCDYPGNYAVGGKKIRELPQSYSVEKLLVLVEKFWDVPDEWVIGIRGATIEAFVAKIPALTSPIGNGKSRNPDAQGWKDIADKLEATERKPT